MSQQSTKTINCHQIANNKILIDLVKMLLSPKPQPGAIIRYIQHYKIDINSYLPNISDPEMFLPLIYYCVSTPDLVPLFEYLMQQGVRVDCTMITDRPEKQIELLYYSQIAYIPTLVKGGAKINPQSFPNFGQKLLVKGNVNKIIVLYSAGAVTREALQQLLQTPGLIFRVLDQLYARAYQMCQAKTDVRQIDEIINNYINVFKFFFKNGININQVESGEPFFQRVLNTYFVELIRVLVDYLNDVDNIDILHYSNFDLTNRQVMSHFYNEANFTAIENIVRHKLVPTKVTKRTLTLKKTIPIMDR